MHLLSVLLLLAQSPAATPSPSPEPAVSPTPAVSPSPPPLVIPLAGVWAGSVTLTTEGPGHCRYEGPSEPPAMTLELRVAGETGSGKLAIDLKATAGAPCAAIRSRAKVEEATLTPSTISFRDDQGRDWNLALKEGALQGLFSGPGASGEVLLRKTSKSVGGSGVKRGALGVIGANIVGLGALAGINKVAQDNPVGASGLICSPRVCVIGGPGEPCDCNTGATNGADCGQTTSGINVGGSCALPDRPCQSELSCNNLTCEDRFGRCPF